MFIELGLSSPSWVTLESPDAYSHVAIAYLKKSHSQETSNLTAELSPMLQLAFRKCKQIIVRACSEQLQCGPRCLTNTNEKVSDIMQWQASGLTLVSRLGLEIIYCNDIESLPINSAQVLEKIVENPQLV